MTKQQKIAEKRNTLGKTKTRFLYDVTPRYIPVKIINQYDIQYFAMQKYISCYLNQQLTSSGNYF